MNGPLACFSPVLLKTAPACRVAQGDSTEGETLQTHIRYALYVFVIEEPLDHTLLNSRRQSFTHKNDKNAHNFYANLNLNRSFGLIPFRL